MFETNIKIHWVGRFFVVELLSDFGEVLPHFEKVVVAHEWTQKRDGVVENLIGTSGVRGRREGNYATIIGMI